MKKPDWEAAQLASVDTKQPTSGVDESPAKLGETATERKDQSGISKASTPQISLQAFGKNSQWKILLIICRLLINKIQATGQESTLVNRQLHPKMKPLVVGSHGCAA